MSERINPNPEVQVNQYIPYELDYRDVHYEFTPDNTVVFMIEDDPDMCWVAMFNPDGKDIIGEPIFNYYLCQWLVGETKDRNRSNIQNLYGWKIEPIVQATADKRDRNLQVHFETYDLSHGDSFPEDWSTTK